MTIEIGFGDREDRSIDIFTAIMQENGFECVVAREGSDAVQPMRVFMSKDSRGDIRPWDVPFYSANDNYHGGFLTPEVIHKHLFSIIATPAPPCYADMYHGPGFDQSLLHKSEATLGLNRYRTGFKQKVKYGK